MLLSSHILSEVERLADRVTIIREGRSVESGTLAELRHLRRTKVVAEVAGPAPDLTGLPGVHRRTRRRDERLVLGRARGHRAGARRPDRMPASAP